MKKLHLLFTALALFAFIAFYSCQSSPKSATETTEEVVEEAVEEAAEMEKADSTMAEDTMAVEEEMAE